MKFPLHTLTDRLIPAHFLEDLGVVVHPDGDDPVVVVGPLLVQVLYPGYVPVEVRGAGTRQHLYRAPTLPNLHKIGSRNLFLKQKLMYKKSSTNNIYLILLGQVHETSNGQSCNDIVLKFLIKFLLDLL